jgi:hypothetical protein
MTQDEENDFNSRESSKSKERQIIYNQPVAIKNQANLNVTNHQVVGSHVKDNIASIERILAQGPPSITIDRPPVDQSLR